jgi:hypothetical protein
MSMSTNTTDPPATSHSVRIIISLLLALVAGLINFVYVRGLATPRELVAANANLKPDTEITDVTGTTQITKFTVRTDHKDLFKSAVPWAERGVLLHRKVTREISTGEAIFYTDVRTEGTDNVQAQLRPGEQSYTFVLRESRIAPGVKVGDAVVVVTTDDLSTVSDPAASQGNRRVVGPYRVVGLVTNSTDPIRIQGIQDEFKKVSLAIPAKDQATLNKLSIQLDASNGRTHLEFEGKSGS